MESSNLFAGFKIPLSSLLECMMSVMIYKYMKNRKQYWILRKIQELSKIRKKKDLVGGECRH